MTITIDTEAGIARITLSRPDRLNALDESTRLALAEEIGRCDADPTVGALVLTGAGRAFCAGQDLSARHELESAGDTVARTYNPIVEAITGAGIPVVAAVNGVAAGAGMGIALASDVVLMSESASMACVFGKIGLVPDTGVSWSLVRAVGYPRALGIAASGRRISAEESVQLSLATEVVPPEELLVRAHHLARELAAIPRTAFSLTKRLLREAVGGDLSVSLAAEARAQAIAAEEEEHHRLLQAFLER